MTEKQLEKLKQKVEVLKSKGKTKALIKLLKHDHSGVVKAAARALGEVGDKQAVAPLIELLNHDNRIIVYEAIKALGQLGDTRAANLLIKLITNPLGYFDSKRELAAEVLGEIGDRKAVEPLIDELFSYKSQSYCIARVSIVKALDALCDSRAVEPLIEVIENDTSRFKDQRGAVEIAAEALGKLGDRKAVEPLIGRLADCEDAVRLKSAQALSLLGEPGWAEFIKGDSGDFQRIAESGQKKAEDSLIDTMRRGKVYKGHEDDMVLVAKALGSLGDKRAIEPLINILSSDYGKLRVSAAETLAALGEPAFQTMIKGDDHDYEKLYQMEDARVTEPILRILYNGSKDVRIEAVKALAKRGGSQAKVPLLQLLNIERDSEVKQAETEALLALGCRSLLEIKEELDKYIELLASSAEQGRSDLVMRVMTRIQAFLLLQDDMQTAATYLEECIGRHNALPLSQRMLLTEQLSMMKAQE